MNCFSRATPVPRGIDRPSFAPSTSQSTDYRSGISANEGTIYIDFLLYLVIISLVLQYQHRSPDNMNQFPTSNEAVDLRFILSLKKKENLKGKKAQLRAAEAAQIQDSVSRYNLRNKRKSLLDFGNEEWPGHHFDYASTSLPQSIKQRNRNQQKVTTDGQQFPTKPARIKRSLSCNPNKEGYNNNFHIEPLKKVATPASSSPLRQRMRRRSYSLSTRAHDEEDNRLEVNSEVENTSLLVKTGLRSHLQVPENVQAWYIVTDSNVLINNIALLNNILDLDKQCCLIVPHTVINKIETARKSAKARVLACRALFFIFQQVEVNRAIIDEDNDVIESCNEDIINCCLQIIDQGNHVVLLTDDIDLISNENASNIPIFMATVINGLVKETNINETDQYKLDEIKNTTQDRNIHITFENKPVGVQQERYDSPEECINPERVLEDERPEIPSSTNDGYQIENKGCDISVQADALSSLKISDDLVILPTITSSKACKTTPSRTIGVQADQRLSQNLPPKTQSVEKKRLWRKPRFRTSTTTQGCVREGNSTLPICSLTNSTVGENIENSPWGLSSHTSTESLYKHQEQNDASSESSSCILGRVKPRVNVSIEETSNSSTATPIILSGIEKLSQVEDRAVMFDVADAKMENVLRMKMDEWVSRFVQIMEEALSQVLRCEPSLAMENLPPPWTAHEAAECLKLRYAHDADVVDAANKFLHISFVNGGIRGKIRSNISPHKFMKMYSYGVYLIDALQSVLIDNEDLQAAAVSLSKLLQDIEQPQAEDMEQPSLERSDTGALAGTSAQESTAKVPDLAETDTNKINANPEENKQEDLKTPPRKKQYRSPASTPGKYYLRSQTKKTKEDDTEDVFSGSENGTLTKSVFLTNLELKNNESINRGNEMEGSSPNESSVSGLVTSDGFIQEVIRSPGYEDQSNAITSEIVTEEIVNEEPELKVTEPKIIRNFSRCLEFEKKLKKKKPVFLSDANIWTDSDRDLLLNTQKSVEFYDTMEDYGTEEFVDEDGTFWHEISDIPPVFNSPRISKTGDTSNSENSPRVPKTLDTTNSKDYQRILETVHSPRFIRTVDTTHSERRNIPFKLLMYYTIEEPIKKAYSSIHEFCVKSGERMESQELIADQHEIKTRAEKEISYLDGILSMLKNLRSKKDRKFEGILIEDNDIKLYRIFIDNCLEQGEVLKEALTLVLDACTTS